MTRVYFVRAVLHSYFALGDYDDGLQGRFADQLRTA